MKGITVILYEKIEAGTDSLHNPIYDEHPITVENVLIGQPTTEEIIDSNRLYGKRLEFVLGLPKGETHQWEDSRVDFLGRSFRAFGSVVEGIEENVPTPWHKKVMVERYG